MAEQEQNRSEAATPFKLEEARRRGQAPKSLEVNSLFALFALLLVMTGWGAGMLRDQARLDALVFGHAHRLIFEPGNVVRWLAGLFSETLYGLLPLLLAIAVVAVAANMVQTGPIFTAFPLKPDFERINPVAGAKRMFGWRLAFEMFKNLVKLALFSAAVYYVFVALAPALMTLLQVEPRAYLGQALEHAIVIVFKLALVLALIAIADLVYARWSFADKQKMSRREIREEVKHREGDPRIRARMRELRRETLARSRALRRLPEADVLITNPTHVAVALLYREQTMAAPVVVAKGAGELADRMRELARRHRVPIVESRSLARALFARGEVEKTIPDEFYATVARLLVWVYASRSGAPRQGQPA